MSVENLRYLNQVKQEIQAFTNSQIPVNYFTGEKEMRMDATVQEAEVMFAANDNVRALANSGELQQLHQRVKSASEAAYSNYNSLRQRINTIVLATQAKEDEVYAEIVENHPTCVLQKHNATGDVMHYFTRGYVSLSNITTLDKFRKHSKDDVSDLKRYHD